jgi:hypothetical protein
LAPLVVDIEPKITGSFVAREATELVDYQNNSASIHLLGMTTRSAEHLY